MELERFLERKDGSSFLSGYIAWRTTILWVRNRISLDTSADPFLQGHQLDQYNTAFAGFTGKLVSYVPNALCESCCSIDERDGFQSIPKSDN